jgi:hypothetical protein
MKIQTTRVPLVHIVPNYIQSWTTKYSIGIITGHQFFNNTIQSRCDWGKGNHHNLQN